METFRDLFIDGDPGQLAATLSEMERSLPAGWSRDKDAEARLHAIDGEPMHCFALDGRGSLPAATIFLAEEHPGTLSVSNIIPRDKDQLRRDEYNAIVHTFCHSILRPATEMSGARFRLTADHLDLADWLSGDAIKKLRAFSERANKSTGSSHPFDRKRWFDFIEAAHQGEPTPDATTLQQWLIEDERWPPEVAQRLATEFEFGDQLLSFLDGQRRGA